MVVIWIAAIYSVNGVEYVCESNVKNNTATDLVGISVYYNPHCPNDVAFSSRPTVVSEVAVIAAQFIVVVLCITFLGVLF